VDEKWYGFETYDWLWTKTDIPCRGRFAEKELVFPLARE
jgi:hypothetical protein